MLHRVLTAPLLFLAALTGNSFAQTGTLDQVSPWPVGQNSAWFNGDASFLIWQAQVRHGIAGQLEGFKLRLAGNAGAQVDVRLRIGDGWNTSPIVFQTQLTKTITGDEDVFVNATSANITTAVGATLVIEMQGNNTQCGLLGSYMDPAMGPPFYPEPLFLGGPGCFSNCGWRIGFETYVLGGGGPPVVYCTSGTTTNGCNASISASGQPDVTHTAPCQITISGVEGQKNGIIFYGLNAFTQPWCSTGGGSSFLCVKAPSQRTGTQNSGGTTNACDGVLSLDWNAYQLANPTAVGQPWSAGTKAYVQGWFRDPPSCKTTSLSDAVELTYQ